MQLTGYQGPTVDFASSHLTQDVSILGGLGSVIDTLHPPDGVLLVSKAPLACYISSHLSEMHAAQQRCTITMHKAALDQAQLGSRRSACDSSDSTFCQVSLRPVLGPYSDRASCCTFDPPVQICRHQHIQSPTSAIPDRMCHVPHSRPT